MKTVASISLGAEALDFDFNTRFLGKRFRVVRQGTNQDEGDAASLVNEWQDQADAFEFQ